MASEEATSGLAAGLAARYGLDSHDASGDFVNIDDVTSQLTMLQSELAQRSIDTTAQLLSDTSYAREYERLTGDQQNGSRLPSQLLDSYAPAWTPRKQPPRQSAVTSRMRQKPLPRTPGQWTAMGYKSPSATTPSASPRPMPLALPTRTRDMREMLSMCVTELRLALDRLQAVTIERDGLLEMLLEMQASEAPAEHAVARCRRAHVCPRPAHHS